MKPFVIITGMHRSGTSFLVRALNLCGMNIGDIESLTTTEWMAHKSNPKGHWENNEFVNLGKTFLENNSGSWDNIPNQFSIDESFGSNIKNEIINIYNELSLATGFKDPNAILYFESWKKYLPKNTIVVGIFRHPLKVCESLKNRNDFSYEKSLSLWKEYNERLLNIIERENGFLLDFDWDKKRLLAEIKQICENIGLVPLELDQWFADELKRSDKTFDQKYHITNDINAIYHRLQQKSETCNTVKYRKNFSDTDLKDAIKFALIQNKKQAEFFSKINEKNINLVNNLKNKVEPLSTLISIYSTRPDLRKMFPEADDGDYLRLVSWAIYIIHNDVNGEDETKKSLEKYSKWYDKYQNDHDAIKNMEKLQAEINHLKSNFSQKQIEFENERRFNQDKIEKMRKSIVSREKEITNIYIQLDELVKQNSFLQEELLAIKSAPMYQITKNITASLDKRLPVNSFFGKWLRKKIANRYATNMATEFVYEYSFDDHIQEETRQEMISSFKKNPKISILMPTFNSETTFLRKAIKSVERQYYGNWELCIVDDCSERENVKEILEQKKNSKIKIKLLNKNLGIGGASNECLKMASGEYVILLDHDDELSNNCLLEIVREINQNSDADYIYSDEDKIDLEGRHVEPFFKPDWSPDLFLSYNYPIHVSVFKKEILTNIGGFRTGYDGAQDYDLILRYLESVRKIAHIPKVLYSWRKNPGSTSLSLQEKGYAYEAGKKALQEYITRKGIQAECIDGLQRGTYHVKYKIKGNPMVSIIIPSRSHDNLRVCVDSIFEKSTYKNYEIIVLDSSKDKKINELCNAKKIIRLQVENENFNFSKVNNMGVVKSKGEYLLFLNDDTSVISSDWIESLLEHAQRPEIAIAGAKLLYQNNHVQHAGTVIGIKRHAGNYGGMQKNDGGYFSFAKVIRNCSAVTAACMMMRKNIFDELGGYDKNLAKSWQDVDLCIRAIERGKNIVFTPYSLLYHFEGKTRGNRDSSEEELTARRIFREKHLDFILEGDPFYNPNLSLTTPFKIGQNINKPLKILSDMYERREDLRKMFPNDYQNNFRGLVDWVSTHGSVVDSERDTLQKFYDYYYENCSEQARPLAKKIRKFLTDSSLQKKFPEVFEGNFENLIKSLDEIAKTQKVVKKHE